MVYGGSRFGFPGATRRPVSCMAAGGPVTRVKRQRRWNARAGTKGLVARVGDDFYVRRRARSTSARRVTAPPSAAKEPDVL